MAKNRKQASLTNVVQYDSNFNLSIGTSTSSSFNSSGSIIAASGFTGSLSGSVFGIGSPVSFSSSVSSDLINLESKSASVDISISNINSFTASNANTSLNQLSGSYATTGSNSFYGTQVFSGSVYIANDLVVQGSSSIQYISASSVSIGTNIIQLNTANPSVRFAGLTIIDSGSVGGSGSFLYDSVHDEFIFLHRGNGTNVTSSHFVLGPETYDNLGNELYLTCNRITKGTGKEHLVNSCIFDNGTTICVNGNFIGTGTACFGNSITATDLIISDTYANDPLIKLVTTTSGNVEVQMRTATTTYNAGIGVVTSGYDFGLFTNNTSRMNISSTGNIGIGATPCAWAAPTAGKVIQLGNRASLFSYNNQTLDLATNFYFDGGDYRYIESAYATLLRASSADGTFVFYNAASGTTGGVVSLSERLRITNAGISCFSSTVCAPIVARCASKWQLNGAVEGGNNACALVINIDNSRAVRVRAIVTGVSGYTMTSMGMYEAIVYRLGGGAGNESKRFAVLVDCNASPGNGQGIKMDVVGDTLYIQNKSGMSYAQSIVAWAEIFYA
jgi:hypothetical protein